MKEYNLDKILPFLIFIIPGLVSLKIWSLFVPSENKKISDYIFEVMCYSALNFAFLFWLIYILLNNDLCIIYQILILLLLFVVFPIIWPIIISKILKSNKLKGRIIHPTPKAWDHFFNSGESCFMLIHLKNDKLIGGLYAQNSFASSFPAPEDLYLIEVWKVTDKGEFIEKIENTKGLLISKDYINFIELFEIIIEENKND